MLEENVPLDSSKQKQFVKSIKGIKRLLKKSKDVQPKVEEPKEESKVEKVKKKLRERGLVYLSHIPHGFYEHEMTQYFKQFGVVTNVRVIRSKHTGNSKGHAFVEFKDPTVAKIVAETMNNYLMGKRLIKAVCIPPKEQRRNAFRKRWNSKNNPGHNHRLKMKKAYNATKDEKGELARATKLLSNLSRTKEKLNALGINYDFFKPVDVPQSLISTDLNKEKEENVIIKHESPTKVEDQKNQKSEIIKNEKVNNQLHKKNNEALNKSKLVSSVKVVEKKADKLMDKKGNKTNQKTLIKSAIKPLDNFIKVEHEEHSSDSAYEFDSDEYEKVIQNDNNDDSLSDENEDGTSLDDLDSDVVTTGTSKQKSSQIMKGIINNKQNIKQKYKRKSKQNVTVSPKKIKLKKAKAPQKTKAPQKVKELIKKKK